MNKFSILCTKDQIRKALELGAPLETCDWRITDTSRYIELDNEKGWHIQIPTAEEMIGWLEEQGFIFSVFRYGAMVEYDSKGLIGIYEMPRIEATIAAIDAALEYLENQIQ